MSAPGIVEPLDVVEHICPRFGSSDVAATIDPLALENAEEVLCPLSAPLAGTSYCSKVYPPDICCRSDASIRISRNAALASAVTLSRGATWEKNKEIPMMRLLRMASLSALCVLAALGGCQTVKNMYAFADALQAEVSSPFPGLLFCGL